MVYRARQGARISDKDASLIGAFIEDRFKDGPVTAKALVAAAKAKRASIHRFFEWDDANAAQEYRVWQARHYLNSIEVVVETQHGEERTRAFHVVQNGERAYLPERVVWQTPEYGAQVIARALRELETWQRNYRQYEELAGVAEAIAAATEKVAA